LRKIQEELSVKNVGECSKEYEKFMNCLEEKGNNFNHMNCYGIYTKMMACKNILNKKKVMKDKKF
jgi:hypothetical protein